MNKLGEHNLTVNCFNGVFDCFIRVYKSVYPGYRAYQTFRKVGYMSRMGTYSFMPTLGHATAAKVSFWLHNESLEDYCSDLKQ